MPTKAKTKVKTKVKIKGKASSAKTSAKAKARTKSKIKTKTKNKPARTKLKAKAKSKVKTKPKVTKKITLTSTQLPQPSFVPKIPSLGPVGFKPYQLKKGEEYMSEPQLEHFRRILLLWKQQLLEEFDRTKQHMQNDAANFADPLDRAVQEEEFNFELRTRDRERKLVKKIEDALERINNNDYGYCVDCGAEIGIRRLEARPTAAQCIDCKTFEEIKERQTGMV